MDRLISLRVEVFLMKGNLIRKMLEEIGEYMGEREVILSFLLTGVFMVLAFVAHTRMGWTTITYNGMNFMVHASYYGFPYEMISVVTPLTSDENGWLFLSGQGNFNVLLGGLCINFLLYFSLAFLVVLLSRRLMRMMRGSQV
jgi:hypothetical protein